MADIIAISSGSEEDSDVEVLSILRGSDDGERTPELPAARTAPPLIDLTDYSHPWAFTKRKGGTVELVDLSESSPEKSDAGPQCLKVEERNGILDELTSEKTMEDLDIPSVRSLSELLESDMSSPTLPQYSFLDELPFDLPHPEWCSATSIQWEEEKKEEIEHIGEHTPNYSGGSASLGSRTPCYSSDGDMAVFSDDMEEGQGEGAYQHNEPYHTKQLFNPQPAYHEPVLETVSAESYGSLQIDEGQPERPCSGSSDSMWTCLYELTGNKTPSPKQDELQENVKQDCPESTFLASPPADEQKVGEPSSPTSTEILAGDSPDWLQEDVDLTLDSPSSLFATDGIDQVFDSCGSHSSRSPQPSPKLEESRSVELSDTESEQGVRGVKRKERCYVSRSGLKKLKLLTGLPVQDLYPGRMAGDVQGEEEDCDLSQSEDEEDSGKPEPMSLRSLRLVHTTMEENYPEGTLQFLFDFLHPRFYPPRDIVSHVLRNLLLDSDCQILATEAYNLIMKIQQLHPAKLSTVQWDWELLTSVMDEKERVKKPVPAVLCMFLTYVVQTLEDDFHRRLAMQELHRSIAKATLSCDRKFPHVRDVVNWLITAVINASNESEIKEPTNEGDKWRKRERDDNLKIAFLLQKMLALAIEVDRSPTCSSSKVSLEMFHTLISIVPHRRHRLLLLKTMESKLLQCKLAELLLDHACPQKTKMPMSLNLLLHFFQNTTLPSDPTDGIADQWRRWNELLHLLFMLFVSYGEVTAAHLRCSVTERTSTSTLPIVTEHDKISLRAVQDATRGFHSRVSDALGAPMNSQLEERTALFQSLLMEVVFKDS